MKKIYWLANCGTCQRIVGELGEHGCALQNIKEQNISGEELDEIASKIGSYEALFSKQAMKYKSLGLNKMKLEEADFRRLILEEYTFLKRPFILNGDEIFIGNASKTVAAAVQSFKK